MVCYDHPACSIVSSAHGLLRSMARLHCLVAAIRRADNLFGWLQVRYLKVIEKSGYQALPWVRYITTAGNYEIRMN